MVTVHTADLHELTHLTAELFRATTGVRATRTRVSTGTPIEGSRWRLRSLDADQAARIEAAAPLPWPRPPAPEAPWDALDARLLELLSAHGRMSLRDRAAVTGAGPTTARRRVQMDPEFVAVCTVASVRSMLRGAGGPLPAAGGRRLVALRTQGNRARRVQVLYCVR
ncbi:AsnC family protein [Streptomyces sp. BH097]|uniref:AsnC family protein n=1 Tax=unclassified Streptomyces TaxID=2593676 RepID=UPI003BB70B3B